MLLISHYRGGSSPIEATSFRRGDAGDGVETAHRVTRARTSSRCGVKRDMDAYEKGYVFDASPPSPVGYAPECGADAALRAQLDEITSRCGGYLVLMRRIIAPQTVVSSRIDPSNRPIPAANPGGAAT